MFYGHQSSIIHDLCSFIMDFYGYPCIDLLWILDPGFERMVRVGLGQVRSVSVELGLVSLGLVAVSVIRLR